MHINIFLGHDFGILFLKKITLIIVDFMHCGRVVAMSNTVHQASTMRPQAMRSTTYCCGFMSYI